MKRLFPSTVLPVLALLVTASAVGAQTGVPEVRDVRFDGNRAFPSDSLARAIVTRETECRSVVLSPFCWAGADFSIERSYFRARDLPLDSLRLKIWYQDRGYREAIILPDTLHPGDRGLSVVFTIDEGRPVLVDTIEFVGLEDVQDPELLEALPIREGDALSYFELSATRDTLARRLANRGHARVEVLRSSFIPADDPYRARVTFDVVPGPQARYGEVTVVGDSILSVSTIMRTLEFDRGDLYRVDQLIEGQARPFSLEVVRSASVQPDFGTGLDSVIPVTVRIQEGDLHRVRGGGGWSTSECFNVDASWVSRNFAGGGRRLQVRGRLSNILASDFQSLLCPQSGQDEYGRLNGLASVDFVQPWIFSSRNALQASVFAERQSLPDIFVRKSVGASLSLTRTLGPRTPMTLSYRPEYTRLNDDAAEILFCTSFLACTSQDIAELSEAQWLAPVGLSLTRTTTNNVLNPSRGYTLLFDFEHAATWTGSQFPYDRFVAESTWYNRIASGVILATRLRSGWVRAGGFGDEDGAEIVHPQKRFYAGGANSVRGFAQSRLGPRVLTADVQDLLDLACTPESILDQSCDVSGLADRVFDPRPTGGTRVVEGNVEVRFPLSSSFEAATFADVGQVWGDGEDMMAADLEITPGFGVRYLSPIGPLRVDVAYRFRGGEELSVITSQIRPVTATDKSGAQLRGLPRTVNGEPNLLPWVRGSTFARLPVPVLFDDSPAGSLSRFQLHISIGQAF